MLIKLISWKSLMIINSLKVNNKLTKNGFYISFQNEFSRIVINDKIIFPSCLNNGQFSTSEMSFGNVKDWFCQ